MDPGLDAIPGDYLFTLKVLDVDFPFQVTLTIEDEEIKEPDIQAFHVIYKTLEAESWQYSIQEEIEAGYTVMILPRGNPLDGIFEIVQQNLVIHDKSDPEIEPGEYYIDLLLIHENGEERA